MKYREGHETFLHLLHSVQSVKFKSDLNSKAKYDLFPIQYSLQYKYLEGLTDFVVNVVLA